MMEYEEMPKDTGSKLPVSEWLLGFRNNGTYKRHTMMGAVAHKGWKLEDRVSKSDFVAAVEEYRNIKVN